MNPERLPSLDRVARDELATLVRRFLHDEVTAFQVDDRLDRFRDSDDSAVRFVTEQVWCFYDDLIDHKVVLQKDGWDYLQRLLLLLASDCQVETTVTDRWSFRQPLAGICLLAMAGTAVATGVGFHLLLIAVPFGILAALISEFDEPAADPADGSTIPFASVTELKRVYRSAGFRKEKYPVRLRDRSIRSPFEAWIASAFNIAWMLVFSPVPLMLQLLPDRESRTRVVLP